MKEESSPPPRRRRWLVGCLLAVVLGPLALALLLLLVFFLCEPSDDPPPDLSLMELTEVEPVLDENNAFPVLLEVADALERPGNPAAWFILEEGRSADLVSLARWMIEDGLDPEDPVMREVQDLAEDATLDDPVPPELWRMALGEEAELLATIRAGVTEALRRGQLAIPPLEHTPEEDLDYLYVWKQIATALVVEAEARRELGQLDEARDLALDVLAFGSLLEQSRGYLVHQLVALFVQQSALEEILAQIGHADWTIAELRELESRLAGHAPCVDCFQDSFRNEFWMQANLIDRLASGSDLGLDEEVGVMGQAWIIQSGYMLLPNRTKALAAEWMAPAIRNLERRVADWEEGVTDEIEARATESVVSRIWRGNAVGEALMLIAAPALGHSVRQQARLEAALGATRIHAALRAHEIANGALPATLEELVPELLPELPLDPYDGFALRYSRERLEVYSGLAEMLQDLDAEDFRFLRIPQED